MAAAAWCAAANERGAPSDVTVTFSSSRRFRQAALGFRFRSGQRESEREVRCMLVVFGPQTTSAYCSFLFISSEAFLHMETLNQESE